MSPHHDALNAIQAKSSGVAASCDHPITINFHTDRRTHDGMPLLLAMAKDGQLKSQFETGTSNGGLTAFTGGERWRWEQRVFDGSYDHALPSQRPKYGALNVQALPYGASPRFGSAHFRLKAHVLARTTFCYPDSFFEPEHFATHRHLAPLIDQLNSDDCDPLDAYIEAQIHGPLSLQQDVEALVLDPIYQGTEIERQAQQLPVTLEWHQGFALSIEKMAQYPGYRGAQFIEIARTIAREGLITAEILSHAIHHLGHDPQDIKKVWHYLARFGYPQP
ncbi:DUF3626 domain-containing protein [Ferrimonas pelagia]|uniref:DUF3626 domain-containing protein n=1 Tax=Ferrimonas pelagia TaxID=1177826 RepID=UPI0031F19D42